MPRKEGIGGERPRYRRISTCMWGDEKFRQLSAPKPNAQSLWLFLICGPQTRAVPGLFSIGEAALAELLSWPLPGLRKAWRELERDGMARADWTARLVWIPNALKHNPPESPNVVRGWRATIDEMPECPLKVEAVAALASSVDAFGEGFRQAFRQAFPDITGKPSGHPKPYQEQEQEHEQEQELRGSEGFADCDPTFERFWSVYPRKEGRQGALKIWREMRPSPAVVADIVAAVQYHRATKGWKDAIASGDYTYVPMPKTYLADGRWQDLTVRGGFATASPSACRHGHTPPCIDDASCTSRYLAELRGASALPGEARPS